MRVKQPERKGRGVQIPGATKYEGLLISPQTDLLADVVGRNR